MTEYVATTYECPQCKQTEDPQFVKDEGCPPALIEKSYATPSLVAGILKNKFVLGLPPMLFYRYSPTRSGDNAVEMLKGSPPRLYLMVDGFQGYDKLKDVKRCACYAHIRRYFLDTVPKGGGKDLSNPAVQGVAYCGKLFHYERGYKEQGLSYEQRQKCRLKDEKPVVEAFIKWLGKQKMSSTSNKFNKALTYARNCQDILMTYLEDGRCSLSNNMSLYTGYFYPHLFRKTV